MFAQQDPGQIEELKQAEELCSQAEAILQQGQTTLEAAFIALRQSLELLGESQELVFVRIRNRFARAMRRTNAQPPRIPGDQPAIRRQDQHGLACRQYPGVRPGIRPIDFRCAMTT